MENRTPLKARVHSPAPCLLTPNDDDRERAQVRLARAAALRRKSGLAPDVEERLSTTRQQESNVLSKERILELHNNCIKLAAENKITQRNTWDLKLIDHLSTLVEGDDEDEDNTNFQKASCTLEAGVRIYSTRVDSVHTEAYKVLGGLSRTTAAPNRDNTQHEDAENSDNGEANVEEPQKYLHKKVGNCSSTLEASFANLNIKKFDVGFTVDPLFHQMSAQFDEGGAKGLLLNTLSVFHGCEIVFDSQEVPEKIMKFQDKVDAECTTVDLSFMKDNIDCVMKNLLKETEISPTLKEILRMLDDPYRAVVEAEPSPGSPGVEDTHWPWQENHGALTVGDGDEISTIDSHVSFNDYEGMDSLEGLDGIIDNSRPQSEMTEDLDEEDLGDGDVDNPGGEDSVSHGLVDWLTASLGQSTQVNAWAGPNHWKYRKPRDAQQGTATVEVESTEGTKKKRKKCERFFLDFENPAELDMSKFEPPQKPNSTLLVHRGGSFSSLLPVDLHYEPLNLVSLFLQSSVQCIGKWRRQKAEGVRSKQLSVEDYEVDSGNDERAPSFDGDWPDDDDCGNVDDVFENELINVPHKVQKISINYNKTSKQVDVHMLKATLWEGLQHKQISADMAEDTGEDEEGIPFQELLDVLPEDCPAAAQEDISVHICFLCLLHLANEHNLCIKDCSTIDDLRIFQVDKCATMTPGINDG
ncbi:hypothetical protein BDL97_08G003800 [Sphagnum fallax]|nr:hypothetical protein BDL97_08G003800 [Sphagnum fallax]